MGQGDDGVPTGVGTLVKRATWSVVAIAMAACTGCQTVAPSMQAITPGGEHNLAAILDAHLAAEAAPGVYLFAANGDVLLHKAYGLSGRGTQPMEPDIVFPIGSISKQFTAAAALRLAQDGRISLDDTVGRFFPLAPADKRDITIQQLLAHTSGLPRNTDDFKDTHTREEFRAGLFAAPMAHRPGQYHLYSNAGYMLLAQVIEAASGMSFDEYLARKIFRPAGLKRTGFPGPKFRGAVIPPGYDRPKWKETYTGTPMDEPYALSGWYRRGAGGLLSTATDLLKWQQALRSGEVLDDRWAKQMSTPHGVITRDRKYLYGYAWVLQDSQYGPVEWHNGVWFSYYTEIRVFPRTGLIAIGFTNRQQDETFDAVFADAVRLANDGLDKLSSRSETTAPVHAS